VDTVSSELIALLAACRARPADDLPRLVLADWLDENGQPERAEFVRVQVELSHPTADAARMKELKVAELQLLAAHKNEWMAGYWQAITAMVDHVHPSQLGFGRHLYFFRGLLHIQHATGFHEYPPFLAWLRTPEAMWLEQISLLSSIPSFVKIDWPDELSGRIELMIRADNLDSPDDMKDQFRLLAVSSNFTGVRSLSVFEGGEIFLEEISRADVTKLVKLKISGHNVARMANLISTSPFTSLSSLDIGRLSEPALKALIRSPYLSNLTELNFVGSPISDACMVALCGSKLAHSLRAVEFPNTGLGDAGVIALTQSPILAQMHGPRLNLMMNPIGDAGLKALAECEHLQRFRELVLRENYDEKVRGSGIGDAGVIALAESPYAANLQYLDFWRNRITDRGAFALARSPYLNKVVDLSVKENAVTEAGAAALHERFGEAAKV
jgi:uncharacterized protein (TIGR02996 family)